jgi:hypothetical protein
MKSQTALRVALGVLWILLLLIYVASKIDFFTRYNANGTAGYLLHHNIYWVAAAATAFLIWLVEMYRGRSGR